MAVLGREALVECDIIVTQGADNAYAFRYSTRTGDTTTPVDLTGWSARAQLRRTWGGEIWLSAPDQAAITLTSTGDVVLAIDAATTEDPAWNSRSKVVDGEPQARGVWDLELINPDGRVTRLVQGTVTVSPDVTREA